MHSSQSSGQCSCTGKQLANNCCSNTHYEHPFGSPYHLRQTAVHFNAGPSPLPTAPVASSSIPPYDMASNPSFLHCASIRTTSSSFPHSPPPVVYIYELPYNVRKAICDLLDADNTWRELGGRYMGFNDTQLTLISHALLRSDSPTNLLLTKWESSNAKVVHLYRFLADMKHRRAMFYLRDYVDDKLRLLYDAFDEQTSFNSTEMRLHQAHRPSGSDGSSIDSSVMRSPSFKLSSLPEDTFFGQLRSPTGKTVHNSTNSTADQERTLVDINNEKKKNCEGSCKPPQDMEKLDYLLRIEDFEIPYKELAIATDDFCKDNILGSGGFGTVYIGELKGTKVAVKKLKGLDNSAQAFTELRILNCCRIDNILPLFAVSLDGPDGPCLVYQYMCNGSLEDRLLCKNGTSPLSWQQRAKIGEGIARALNFLHTLKSNPYVHGDVKSANILLDGVFEPKLGDFGLARKVEKRGGNEDSLYTHCTVSSVNGTSVYLPNEYLRNKILSPAVDVYSYGIVILEMATGRRAYDGRKLLINSVEDEYNFSRTQSTKTTATHVSSGSTSEDSNGVHENLMDKRIASLTEDRHWFNCLLELGRKCGHKVKSKRPLMIQVLEYFNQCKTTDRIHKLCDRKLNYSTKSHIKSPLELQLWYDFVRRSCGPALSDAVFENFGAQVTQMIEDVKFTISNTSNIHIDRLLDSSQLHHGEGKLGEKEMMAKPKVPEVILEEQTECDLEQPSTVSQADSAMCPNSTATSSTNSGSNCGVNFNLPQLLQFMTMNSNASTISSRSTIEDELSPWEDSTSDLEPNLSTDTESAFIETGQTNGELAEETASVPFIPLLTALGFQSTDIDDMVKSGQIELQVDYEGEEIALQAN